MVKYYDIKAQAGGNIAELWLYGFVGNSLWDDINPKSLINELAALGDVDEIIVHINSEGGSVVGGNAIYNALKSNAAKITVKIEGLAASMASVIAMAGDHVEMADNALMMIHDPWSWAEGNAEEFRKAADRLDKAKHTLIASYAKKTGLKEDEISDLMAAETWFTADEALELGFADSTSEAVDMAACLKDKDLKAFKKIPESITGFFNQSEKTGATTEEGNNMVANAKKEPEKKAGEQSQLSSAEIDAKVKDATAQALKAEAGRRKEISEVFSMFEGDHSALERACLDDMSCSKGQAQEKLLAELSSKKSEPLGYSVEVLADQRDKMRAGFSNALMARVGLAQDNTSNEFRGFSLSEMARYSLEKAGVNTNRMDRLEMVGSAFTHTSSDFPSILKDVMHKTMLKGWDEAPETYQQWTSKGVLTDFRASDRVGINSFGNLDAIADGAEYKYGTVGDRGETIQLATYGKMIALTRQTIINDDLNAFAKMPMMMGRAARRTIGNLVYNVLTTNPNMADGVALFHASHNNLGTAGSIATGTVDELRKLMALQSDGVATALGITPFAILVPEALRGAAIVTVESETEIAASQNNSKRKNSVRNIAQVISDARLDADSATAYYMVANPALYDTIEVAYLDGVEAPFLEQQQGWSVDGTQLKVRIDAGVKALDHRTMAKNAGA